MQMLVVMYYGKTYTMSTCNLPARLDELLLKVMPLLAPPGSTLSLAATDRKRLNGTTHVVMKPNPKMYSRLCHESLQKCKPHNTLLKMKKPAEQVKILCATMRHAS